MNIINLAKKGGSYEEVAKLIDHTFCGDLVASVNYQEPGTGYTALHYAVKKRDHKLVNLLLNNFTDTKL